MKEEQNNKTKWLHLRLSVDEYGKIHKQFSKTTCRKLSEYARNKLLDKHVTTYYRNQSLDDLMAALMPLKKSLYAVSNNLNQAVRKLNSMPQNDFAETWIRFYGKEMENAIKQVADINNNIQKFAEKWLQDSTQTRP